jgi:hypothetical protein
MVDYTKFKEDRELQLMSNRLCKRMLDEDISKQPNDIKKFIIDLARSILNNNITLKELDSITDKEDI